MLDIKTCIECVTKHGKIFPIDKKIEKDPPSHPRCRCDIYNRNAFKDLLLTDCPAEKITIHGISNLPNELKNSINIMIDIIEAEQAFRKKHNINFEFVIKN